MTALLETKHLTKRFPTPDGRELTACDAISLTIAPGETLGIVGESGCGKSTLARMLLKLTPPTAGQILLHGRDITASKGEARRQERRAVQMVFQDPSRAFNPRMRVRDILCEPMDNFGLIDRARRDEAARWLLRLVELPEDFANRYPHSMSGGQRQRIGIARALAVEPELIVMDEATAALDVSVQKELLAVVSRIQKRGRIAIAFICHDLALVKQFCDRAAVMYLGNIVETLPAGALPEAADLRGAADRDLHHRRGRDRLGRKTDALVHPPVFYLRPQPNFSGLPARRRAHLPADGDRAFLCVRPAGGVDPHRAWRLPSGRSPGDLHRLSRHLDRRESGLEALRPLWRAAKTTL